MRQGDSISKCLLILILEVPFVNDCTFKNFPLGKTSNDSFWVIHKLPTDLFPELVAIVLKIHKKRRSYDQLLKDIDKFLRKHIIF